jgi:integrase
MPSCLTDTAIKAAIARRKRAKLFDGEGLYLLLRPGKPPYWRQKYYYAGKEKLISHGVYPRVSLKMARKRLAGAKAVLDAGGDPSAHRKAQKDARRNAANSSFEEIAREWFSKREKKWAPSNAEKIIARLGKDVFPWLGQKSIGALGREEILACLRRVEERGALESARRVRQYVHSVFEYAIETGRGGIHNNPTPRPNALASPEKGKFASITDPHGVGGLIRAISGYQGSLVTRTALRLAPLLFARPSELREAEWREFDLNAAIWRIPAERMKMKTAHLVPLSAQALALLREVQQLTGSGRYVFPSERTNLRAMSDGTLTAALRSLGYSREQMTVHGFRHMASTLLNESGKWRPDAIERQLAHMPRDEMRAVYNAAQHLAERRRMMQWWSDYLDGLASSNAKVVSIEAARSSGR